MKYEIQRLDGRFTYRDLFEYCIKFSNNMAIGQGPLQFNNAMRWFLDTYGWSAEIRGYDKMLKWTAGTTVNGYLRSKMMSKGIMAQRPDHCNPHWSWTNGYDDLRIYVASDAELNFFQLKWPKHS